MRETQYLCYGMRPASPVWQGEYTRGLLGLGFVARKASPCCFLLRADDVACVVHGDDFTFEGPPGALKAITSEMMKNWIVKVRTVLRPEPIDDKDVSILSRLARLG